MPRESTSSPDPSPQTWRTAFLKQARSDYDIFRIMNAQQQPLCHELHYLQMATGKLAKGALCDPNSADPPSRVHSAFVSFLRVAKRMPALRQAFGMSRGLFRNYVDGLLPVAERIENLAPVGDVERPNPEYPWRQGPAIVAPVDYDYPSVGRYDPKMVKMLAFIERCLSIL